MNEWISFKDASPSEASVVPAVWKGLVIYAIYSREHGFIFYGCSNMFQEVLMDKLPVGEIIDVTHWMKLPNAPKEESKCT